MKNNNIISVTVDAYELDKIEKACIWKIKEGKTKIVGSGEIIYRLSIKKSDLGRIEKLISDSICRDVIE